MPWDYVVALNEFYDVFEALLVLDDAKQQMEEYIVNTFMPVVLKGLLEVMTLKPDEIML